MEKKRHPALILLLIPIQLLIDLAVVWIASELDLMLATQESTVLGHPVPGMTIVVTIIFSFITLLVVLEAVIRAIVGTIKYTKKKREPNE